MSGSSMQLACSQVAAWLPGSRVVGAADTVCSRVHTDTRTISAGDLFVALKGDNFDANTLLHEAVQRGAHALVCQQELPAAQIPTEVTRIEVPNTTLALGQIATGWRKQLALPLIAVTGSNGKTTVT